MASFGWKIIRGLFGAGELLSPWLSGRVAFELFSLAPSRRRLSQREKLAVERAAGFMQTARHHRIAVGRNCVAVHEFRPLDTRLPVGSVLVMHGWGSRTEYMAALIEGLRSAGFRVFSIDLPGHGHSTGRRLNLLTAMQSAAGAAQWFGPFDAVVGHSFGGAAAVNAVAGSIERIAPLPAARIVTIAAPDSIGEVLAGFGRHVALGPRSYAAMARRIERLTGNALSDFSGSKLLARTPVPTLVLHAPDDREVPADDARSYATAGEHVVVHWAEGLGHRRILSDPGIVDRAVAFLTGKSQSDMPSLPNNSPRAA